MKVTCGQRLVACIVVLALAIGDSFQENSTDVVVVTDAIDGDPSSTSYHKDLFPMDHWDGLGLLGATLALLIAAGGGIGGGGMLVPLYIVVLGFHPKHAVALSNVTILGGAIANTALNLQKRHPFFDQAPIDWDVIIVMEPLTIFGAVLGALISKVTPGPVLTVTLSLVLAYTGQRTFAKGMSAYKKESTVTATCSSFVATTSLEGARTDSQDIAIEMTPVQGTEACKAVQSEPAAPPPELERTPTRQSGLLQKALILTLCLMGTVVLTIVRASRPCGSWQYWLLYLASLPWTLAFALHFRSMLLAEHGQKIADGYVFREGEVEWTPSSTVRYPLLCALSGLFAGSLGVGGGIVKGPLMLEMGLPPAVAAASAAAMILFTSASATVSFVALGMLPFRSYAVSCFSVGLCATALGQLSAQCIAKGRQSAIVLGIGVAVLLSAVSVIAETIFEHWGRPEEFLAVTGVCS